MSGFGGGYSNAYQNGGSYGYSANDFTRLTNVVSGNIQKIMSNVSQLNSWLSMYGTRQDTPELRDKLQHLQQQTNQLAKDTNKSTKDLGNLPLSSNSSEMRQQKMQRERLIEEFMNVLNGFQQFQRVEKEKQKAIVAQTRSAFGSSAVAYDPFAEGSPSDEFHHNDRYPEKKQQTTLQIDATDTDLELMREREAALRQLETDIMDVNQIFKDLGTMVHEQGDMIDSIEANVESASVSVEQGTGQLRQAAIYQNKSRRTKCILLIILLVVITIIAIILGVTLRKK